MSYEETVDVAMDIYVEVMNRALLESLLWGLSNEEMPFVDV